MKPKVWAVVSMLVVVAGIVAIRQGGEPAEEGIGGDADAGAASAAGAGDARVQAPAATPEVDASSANDEPAPRAASEPAAEAVMAPAAPAGEEDATEADDETSRQRRIRDTQLGMMLRMAYLPLFDEMQIDEAARAQILSLATDAYGDIADFAEEAMRRKDVPASEVKRRKDAAKAGVREALRDVLDEPGLAAWEAYEDYANQVMYARLLDGQLLMLAPGLDASSRETVKEIWAEELHAHIEAFMQTDAMYTLDHFNDAQLAGLEAGLERLEPAMPADQYQAAAGFVDQVRAMFGAMAGR